MTRIASSLLASLLLATAASAGTGAPSAEPASSRLAPAALRELVGADLDRLDLRSGLVEELELPERAAAPFRVRVRVAGTERELALRPHSVRAEGFRVLVQEADGHLYEADVPAPTTVRGEVVGSPGSWVAGSLDERGLSATLRLGADGELWGVQPLDRQAAAGRRAHAVFARGELAPLEADCGGALEASAGEELAGGESEGGGGGGSTLRLCELACDADYEYFLKNGSSVVTTENDIESVINGVAAIYEDEVGLTYEITTIIVRTTPADPYTSASPGTLLGELQSHWWQQQGSVQRDLAHLFTGRDLTGSTIGIANVNTACSNWGGYGVSQSRYTSNLVYRVALTAHELGHNWSAGHCNEGSDCRIMCSSNGGCGTPTSFGTSSENSINYKINTVSCLDSVTPTQPTLSFLSPTSVPVYGAPPVEIHGQGLSDAVRIHVGTSALERSSFQVIDDTQLRFTPPTASSLGSTALWVETDSAATGSLSLQVVETAPPAMSVPGLTFDDSLTWLLAGGAGDIGFVVGSLTPTTYPYAGFDYLSDGIVLWSLVLGPSGLGSVTLDFPPGLPASLQVHSQAVTFDGAQFRSTPVTLSILL
jgi:hypothetical protein